MTSTQHPPHFLAPRLFEGTKTRWASLVRRHGVFLVFAPVVGLTLTTFLHELFHALVVWGLGGDVTTFSVTPQGGSLGHIQYHLPWPDLGFLVAIGPTLGFGLVTLLVWAVAATIRVWSKKAPPFARTVWWFLVVLGLGDVVVHMVGYLGGADNDIMSAFGSRWDVGGGIALIHVVVVLGVGYPIQRILLQDRDAVRWGEYLGVAAVCLLGATLLFA